MALYSDKPGIYFNSRFVSQGKQTKTLRVNVLDIEQRQNFKVMIKTLKIVRSLNVPAESVVSGSLLLNALSCSVVASHSALRNEGKSPRWDHRGIPVPPLLPWWPGANPGAPLGCTQHELGVLPGEWMLVGIGVTGGGELFKKLNVFLSTDPLAQCKCVSVLHH